MDSKNFFEENSHSLRVITASIIKRAPSVQPQLELFLGSSGLSYGELMMVELSRRGGTLCPPAGVGAGPCARPFLLSWIE
jgi:hypothetical protein